MIEPERWTVAERYMVRYHLMHLVWIALAAISLLIVAVGIVGALMAAGILELAPVSVTLWCAVFVVTSALAAASFAAKDTILRRVSPEWPLYQVIAVYKRAIVVTYAIGLIAGLVPVALALWSGQFGYPLLIIIAPLGAMIYHFPHMDRFAVYAEHLAHGHVA